MEKKVQQYKVKAGEVQAVCRRLEALLTYLNDEGVPIISYLYSLAAMHADLATRAEGAGLVLPQRARPCPPQQPLCTGPPP